MVLTRAGHLFIQYLYIYIYIYEKAIFFKTPTLKILNIFHNLITNIIIHHLYIYIPIYIYIYIYIN